MRVITEVDVTKKIRDAAERQVGYVKHRIEYLLRKFPEVYLLATGGEKVSDFSKTIYFPRESPPRDSR